MGLVVRAVLLSAAVTALGTPVTARPAATVAAQATPVSAAATTTPSTAQAAASGTASGTASGAASGALPCSAGLVALTFDDGPARGLTAKLVRILQDRSVPATFFMVGSRVRQAPRAARLVAGAGFTIGNHTWSHPQLTRLSGAAIRSEMRRTARELRRNGILPSTLMRPPYGALDRRVRAQMRDLGLVPVMWHVDSVDWRGGSARQIAARILRQLRPHKGNIVLQHDGVRNSPASVAAVPLVIRAAKRRGYCFADLDPRGHMEPPEPVTPEPVTAGAESGRAAAQHFRTAVGVPFGMTTPAHRIGQTTSGPVTRAG